MRPHLHYDDITYGQPNNDSLNKKIERIQYNAALAITVIIDVTSKSKLYKELSFSEI